jgi:hypothetical protein
MTRPLALIEGDLTIPLPRPFDGLPPPFGSHHRVLREAVQHAVNEIAKPKFPHPRKPPSGCKPTCFKASVLSKPFLLITKCSH